MCAEAQTGGAPDNIDGLGRRRGHCAAPFPAYTVTVLAMNQHVGEQVLRRARPEDAARCRAIYTPYVLETVVSLEEDPPSLPEMRRRIERALQTHDWWVLESSDRVLGYAYGGPYRSRAAYRWACEVSVYVELGRRRTGAGRLLYDVLLDRLVKRGYLTALAGMTLPNAASEGLHRSLGFEPVGTWRRIGWKFGEWHDVLWVQRHLATPTGPPAEPR